MKKNKLSTSIIYFITPIFCLYAALLLLNNSDFVISNYVEAFLLLFITCNLFQFATINKIITKIITDKFYILSIIVSTLSIVAILYFLILVTNNLSI